MLYRRTELVAQIAAKSSHLTSVHFHAVAFLVILAFLKIPKLRYKENVTKK